MIASKTMCFYYCKDKEKSKKEAAIYRERRKGRDGWKAKLNKRSEDANLSKDKSGPESPLVFRRSWYVEGHIWSGVSSSVLMQRYQRTIRQRGHNTNDCYHLKKQIEEAVTSEKLAHLVKDIRQGNQRNRGQGQRNVKVMVGLGRNLKRPYEIEGPRLTKEIAFPAIPQNSLADALIILEGTIEGFWVRMIYADGGSSLKIMYEHCFMRFDVDTKSRLRKSNDLLVRFLGEIYHPLGLIDLRLTIGESGSYKIVLLEFAIVKCRSPYNANRGNAEFMERNAIASAYETNVKDKRACHTAKPKHPQSKAQKRAYGLRRILGGRDGKKKVVIHEDHPDQRIVINGKLSIGCKQKLAEVLQKNLDVFA
ncbi:hypothetical protein Tco_1302196 [Tanacetum coccineum]